MSVNTYKKSYTLGDVLGSFTKNVLPYMYERIDYFQAVRDVKSLHHYNELCKVSL